jgi:hypothetical protein
MNDTSIAGVRIPDSKLGVARIGAGKSLGTIEKHLK